MVIAERRVGTQQFLQVVTVVSGLLAMADGVWALASADRTLSTVGEAASALAVVGAGVVLANERKLTPVPPQP